jgi:hypothetical protein
LRWPPFPHCDPKEDKVIVQGPAGRHAYCVAEKEALVRLALSAPHTPWVSMFRVGATCARGKVITWFPCSLLVSAVRGSRRVALEYRSWLPETTPRFDRREPRVRFAAFAADVVPGSWISIDNAGIRATDRYLLDSRVRWDQDSESEIQADPIYFPPTAPVPVLLAARTLRAFCRTGQGGNHITWVGSAPHTMPEAADPSHRPVAVPR